MYDPSKIDTNILDVNFQNKINFSADQYFEGKMFDQNYNHYMDMQMNEVKNEKNEEKEIIENEKNSDLISLNKENDNNDNQSCEW